MDTDDLFPSDNDSDAVVVPPIPNLDPELHDDLHLAVDPMAISNNFGIDIYLETLHFVNSNQ